MGDNTFLSRAAAVLAALASAVALGQAPASAAVPLTARLSEQVVVVGRILSVAGQATPDTAVTLAWRRADAWQPLSTTYASSDGTYQLSVPTWWIGDREVRVTTTDASTGEPESDDLSYAVSPGYAVRGSATTFRRYADERYWDPCGVIRWKFNPAGGYAGSLATLRRAVAAVAAATGLRFSYRGTTRKIAFRDSARAAHTDLLISWASPRQVHLLAGSVVGDAMSSTGFDGYYADGEMALDRTAHLRHGFHASGAVDWGQVMLHELGHVVGLAHVSSRAEIMFPSTTRTTHRYGAGDLAGLRAVGASRPCAPPL